MKASEPPNLLDHPTFIQIKNHIKWDFPSDNQAQQEPLPEGGACPKAPEPQPEPEPDQGSGGDSRGIDIWDIWKLLTGLFSSPSDVIKIDPRLIPLPKPKIPTIRLQTTRLVTDRPDSSHCKKYPLACHLILPEPSPVPPPPPPPNDPAISQILPFDQWPQDKKDKVIAEYISAYAWLDQAWPKYQDFKNLDIKSADFDTFFSTEEAPNYSPPQNIQIPPDWNANNVSHWTVFKSDDAFNLYAKMVGFSLALEIKAILPWSISELPIEGKDQILNGTLWFRYVTAGLGYYSLICYPGHILITTTVPAPPQFVFSWFVKNKFIGATKMATWTNFANWQKYNLHHTFGGSFKDEDNCQFKNGGLFTGGYNGANPVVRITNGTLQMCPLYVNGGTIKVFYDTIQHYIGGCGGNSGYTQQVLRVFHIPAEMVRYSHAQNCFILDNNQKKCWAHADDTYGTRSYDWKTDPYSNVAVPEIPIQEILVEYETFKSWVVDYDPDDPSLSDTQKQAYAEQNDRACSKQSIDLLIKYMPNYSLYSHCTYDQNTPNFADTYLFKSYFSHVYTLQELDAMTNAYWGPNAPVGVFNRILQKLNGLGGCNNLAYWVNQNAANLY